MNVETRDHNITTDLSSLPKKKKKEYHALTFEISFSRSILNLSCCSVSTFSSSVSASGFQLALKTPHSLLQEPLPQHLKLDKHLPNQNSVLLLPKNFEATLPELLTTAGDSYLCAAAVRKLCVWDGDWERNSEDWGQASAMMQNLSGVSRNSNSVCGRRVEFNWRREEKRRADWIACLELCSHWLSEGRFRCAMKFFG